MSITGSVNLQGQQVTINQSNTNISENLSILGTGNSNTVYIGTDNGGGSSTSLNVNGVTNLQGNIIKINSNLITYNNVSMFAYNNIMFANKNIKSNFNNGSINIQSNGYLQFDNDIILNNSKFYGVAGNNVFFGSTNEQPQNGNGTDLISDSNSSIYIQSGKDIYYIKKINAQGIVTMIASNDLNFSWYDTNIYNNTYFKVGNQLCIQNNTVLGDTYIEANKFNYGHANINTVNLRTNVKSFVHDQNGGVLSPIPIPVSQQPITAATPTNIIPITTTTQIKSVKNGTSYNSSYDVSTYNDLAFRIIKGSDTSALKQALFPTGENINPNIYKVLIIDGDCNIDGNNLGNGNLTFNNFIIYCTGKISVANNISSITFNNSSIISKNYNLPIKSTMTQLDSTKYTENIKNEVNQYINNYLQ